MTSYTEFLARKAQENGYSGFKPTFMPDYLFPFQASLVDWAVRKGKGALFEDCGLGKSVQQLVWAQNVVEHTNRPVLIMTPLAVGQQTVREAAKFGIGARRTSGEVNGAEILVTNYEKLHHFDPASFAGVVCDESSILKHFSGATQKSVSRFMAHIPHRLLCTATAAPNDYIELGTSSEALGELGYTDMLSRFFKQSDNKAHRMQQIKEQRLDKYEDLGGNYYQKLAFRVSQQIGQWRLKGHAEVPFWKWVASWARACRKPSDLGFPNEVFDLPPLNEITHTVKSEKAPEGKLFTMPAFGLAEEREERRRTLEERCGYAADLVANGEQAIIWVHWNAEGDLVEKLIPGAVQVAGRDPDEAKEERLAAFVNGEAQVLVTKAKIAGFGLNMQNCAHVVTFATHSYEQYYQCVRRCWRFGQTRPVAVDIVATEGEVRVAANMARKAAQADLMFERMIQHMHESERVTLTRSVINPEVPAWL